MPKVIAIWGVAALLSDIVGAVVAGAKGRDASAWAAWSFLFPPVLLVLLFLPSSKGPRPRKPTLDELEERGT